MQSSGDEPPRKNWVVEPGGQLKHLLSLSSIPTYVPTKIYTTF